MASIGIKIKMSEEDKRPENDMLSPLGNVMLPAKWRPGMVFDTVG